MQQAAVTVSGSEERSSRAQDAFGWKNLPHEGVVASENTDRKAADSCSSCHMPACTAEAQHRQMMCDWSVQYVAFHSKTNQTILSLTHLFCYLILGGHMLRLLKPGSQIQPESQLMKTYFHFTRNQNGLQIL